MAADKLKSNEANSVLVANVIYILMNKSYDISRNVRAQWFLHHINSTITLPPSNNLPGTESTELQVVSILPQDTPDEWSVETRHNYRYLVTASANIIFLSEVYSTVYCLDLSPSISAADTQHGEVLLDEIVSVLEDSLNGVVSPLTVPGSAFLFEPQIFVTVIVHTPFYTTPAQQVLVQGWQVTPDNLVEFLAAIRKQLQLLEDTIADVAALAYDQLEAARIRQMDSDKLVGGLFEESSEKQLQMSTSEIPMVSPDSGFINLLRFGMLALRLLPHSSLSNLVVVTDGVISLPDINVLDLALTQLRTNAVAVSFLHVGSQFHPQCAQGFVPYSELMQFISCATFGTYIPHSTTRNCGHGGLNTYHQAFLTWSFKKEANVHELSTPVPRSGEWFVSNQNFYGNREPQLLVKKQTEDEINASLTTVLCCRLHEGFMIKNINLKDNQLELHLMLPWANHIYIEYTVSSEWPVPTNSSVRFSISIKAPYEFLHDITCLMKKPFQSPYRQAVVSQFWLTVKTLAQSDLLLAHLDSFSSNALSFTLPESIRSGMPLFYLPSNSGSPTLSSSDPSCPQFAHFWRPVCLLDPSMWHKWLHTQTLSLTLHYDLPLPRYLHMASPNGRFQGLLCRHAAAMLYNFLKDWTSFVLIENHTYLKFMSFSELDKTPNWFYIVRVKLKAPCAVILIAFLGGTPGKLRHQVVEQFKEKISALTIPQRLTNKDISPSRNQIDNLIESQTRSNVPCCFLLNKPLEKILIRYERMPSEFGTVVFPDGTQPQRESKLPRPTSSLVTTLSRYLHHRRWIWTASATNHNLGVPTVSRILAILTQMRLQEGFKFAHSTAGIINMVLEIQMKCCDQDADHMCDNCRPSIIQYVIFPLHIITHAGKGSTSEEDEVEQSESESTMELISECWIEPQHGVVAKGPAQRAYMENLPYQQLADVIWRMDVECISSILTFEQLCLMSQNPLLPAPPRVNPLEIQPRNPLENWPHTTALSDERIQRIPFPYNVISILPKSQQVELQFPMFIQDLGEDYSAKNQADAPNILLLETLFQQLKGLHDKELFLSQAESKEFVESIFNRQRNVEQHPLPFPRRQSCDLSSGKKTSEKDIKEAEENDSPKIQYEDTTASNMNLGGQAQVSSKVWAAGGNFPGTPESGGGVRKSCGPLYRMYPHVSPHLSTPRTSDVELDTPKWRFFVKRLSQNFIILTFVPASYRDCKTLMLGADPKACTLLPEPVSNIIQDDYLHLEQTEEEKKVVLESTLNPEAKPFQPGGFTKDSPLSNVNCSSPLSNRGWVLDNLDSASNVFDPSPSVTDTQNHSTWELNKGNLEPGSPFRLRARSWEPMKPQSVLKTKKHSSHRVRTHSVGSKGKWIESKLKKKLIYDSDTISLLSSNAPVSKPVFGSINVPVYIYGCSSENLTDAIVLKSEYVKTFKDLFWKKTMKSDLEGEFEPDELFDDDYQIHVQDAYDDSAINQELEIRQHAKAITQVFNKSFGVSLFKSLHLGYNINSLNVQTAMEKCEGALVEINITDYIQTVCKHLKDLRKELDSDDKKLNSEVALSSFSSPSPCQEYRHLHNLIKNKFSNIITTCFKPIPTNLDYYFCFPTWERVDMNTTLEDRKTLDVSHDFDLTFQSELVEFRSDQESAVGAASPWDGLGSVTTPEDAHTSMLSNMDSDSVSIFQEEESEEDISPLFLQLICTIKSNGQHLGNCTVRILPTCLGELVDFQSFPESNLDVWNMSVSLEMLCLTLSQPPKPVVVASDTQSANLVSPNTSTSIDVQFPAVPVIIDNLKHLPDYQHKAISLCVEEIKWLMKDEVAAFLLDTHPVSEATLQLVADHVSNSVNRSSCILQIIPLQFFCGAEQSLLMFLQDFSALKITAYCLKQENEFYYLVKDSNHISGHRGSGGSEHSYSTAPDLWVNSPQSGDSKSVLGSPMNTTEPQPQARVDVEPKTSGWSSIAAWHAEVAHLMETGIVSCDVMDGKEGDMDEHSDWLKELESKRQDLPNFWLIMKVNQESVTVFFHCRYLELDTAEVKLYTLVQKKVVNSIKSLCKAVNQKMLLNNLHDTRMCNPLLEPELFEDGWNSNRPSNQPTVGKPEEGGEAQSEESVTPVDSGETITNFVPGWFSCPIVWETNFSLHPRLKTGPSKPGLSRGIQALRTVLNRFSVSNRKNMFVYKDNSGNVFYLRLYEKIKTINKTVEGEENSLGSVSRSSSINSLNTSGKKADETTSSVTSATSRELRPRVKSFGEVGDTVRQEEYLTLKVHGISETGPEVKCELVQVLHNRLDDAVLEVLSLMLARNPMCKLSPEDVHFIQKPQRLPETTVQFSLPPAVHDNLQAVFYYFRQNLLQFLHMPKYTDTRSQFHFQDYSNPEQPSKQMPENQLFLYNQSPASGNKGIACVAIGLVDMDGNMMEQLSYQQPSLYTGELDPRLLAGDFSTLTATNLCSPQDKDPVRIEFRVWKQGRVNIEQLILKLQSVVRHALWDLVLEYQLLTIPLSASSSFTRDGDVGEEPLNPVYNNVIIPWLQYGSKFGVPAVSSYMVTLQQRHPANITVKEMSSLVSSDGTAAFAYYLQDGDYLSCSGKSVPYSNRFLLVAHNMDQWRATVSEGRMLNIDKLEPKAQKVLQKFSPLLMTTVGEVIQFVPRQRFLIAVLTSDKILLYTYNWAKDVAEMLMKQITLLGQWLTARANVQLGVIQQKMGLFLNQPISRKTDSQASNPFMSQMGDVESLMTFPGTPKGQRSSTGSIHQLQEVLRDTKPVTRRSVAKRPVVTDHVVVGLQQLLDTRAQDRRGHQKKLYTMWQTRGATPNIPISEDVLDVFMLYSRVIHYCVTPLLFLPRWRIQSASTRDFSLRVHKSNSQTSLQESVSPEDKWHLNLCASFIDEYKQYLQSLGFIPIQVGPSTPKKGARGTKFTSKEGRGECYLQKSLLGGVLLFELYMCEPFFYTKLHALECSRLEGKASSGLISQFTLSFLDECDKMKVLMHLHSFTYDYHLRTLTQFISNEESLLPAGYHLTSFLDDFLKYYSKAPNYAYSLVHSGNLVIPKISTPARLLFSYLLNHEDDYPMKIISMVAPGQELDDKALSSTNEYVLVQRSSSSQLMYRDIQDNKQVYEYEIVLVVASEESTDQTVLRLRYFILLTSRREPYAKLENEKKLGKFRTVSTANPLLVTGTMARETTPPTVEDLPEELMESHHSSPNAQLERQTSTQLIEIKQETVNYLGYYSSHEQFMQQLILEQAQAARTNIEEMIAQVSLHCRTHFLWNKLMTQGMSPTYAEFCELLSLGHIEAVADMDPRVSPILAQPISWYQGLIKLLMVKYADHYRTFLSLDGSLQYLLILHSRIPDGFVMVTVDFNGARGELNVVTSRISGDKNVSSAFLPGLIEDVINACCFQLWTGLL